MIVFFILGYALARWESKHLNNTTTIKKCYKNRKELKNENATKINSKEKRS